MTVFSTGQGLWQFTVMPFGLCNTPATLEQLMEFVLCGLTYEACMCGVPECCCHYQLDVPGTAWQPEKGVLRNLPQD
jgi:hypothetical protein